MSKKQAKKETTQKSEIAQLTENMKGLIEAFSTLSNDVADIRTEVEAVKSKPQQPVAPQEITGTQPVSKLPSENPEDVAKRFPDMSRENTPIKEMPDYLPVEEPPVQFIQAKDELLGEEFGLEMEEMTDRAEYRVHIIVPDSYRPAAEIQKYQTHHEKIRTDYQNELTRRNENITEEEIEKKLKAWDEVNDKVDIPRDVRSRNISKVAGLGINQLREWLNQVRANIAKFQEQPLQVQRKVG